MSFVHHTMSRLTDELPSFVEDVIQSGYALFKKYSPEKMAGAAEKYLRERYNVNENVSLTVDLSFWNVAVLGFAKSFECTTYS